MSHMALGQHLVKKISALLIFTISLRQGFSSSLPKQILSPEQINKSKALPLGDLQRVMKDWIILKCLLVKKSPNSIVCQLLHEKECFANVQKHGKIMIFPMGAHMNALCQNHVGSFLKF